MSKTRLEAFTDTVIAIIMTIFVLELAKTSNDSLKSLFESAGKARESNSFY